MKRLVVGLGNPGKSYDKTRHNIGFRAIDEFAQKRGLKFKLEESLKGLLVVKSDLILLKPLTFMNLSGDAVVLAMHYYKIELPQIFVIVDDAALPFGQLRIRDCSGAGGHNGLKSIEESLQSNRYARLRIGVGSHADLAHFVLDRFTEDEERTLPSVLDRAVKATEIWLESGITSAMNFANVANDSSTPSIGETNG